MRRVEVVAVRGVARDAIAPGTGSRKGTAALLRRGCRRVAAKPRACVVGGVVTGCRPPFETLREAPD